MSINKWALTPAMQRYLDELPVGQIVERYRVGWGTAKALHRRGLVKCQWIGMGAYQVLRIAREGA